ncbi:hypothetical protein EDB87DRAFT_1678143 [Lactarius vividus]|nr:hypothetical protein EDB87DRAFT_1678143 [Lactarius vividus]
MQLLLGGEGVWEAHIPSLSPLEALKSLPSPFEVLGYPHTWQMSTNFFGSEDVAPVDCGATRLADNALQFQTSALALEAKALTTTPLAGSLRAPINHQGGRGRDRPNQECYAHQRGATPGAYVPANGTLVVGSQQDTRMRGGMSCASSPKKSQRKCPPSRQKAFPYRRTVKRRNYGPEDWLSSGDPKTTAANDDALSTSAVYAERVDGRLLLAPLLRPVALPDEEESTSAASEELLYDGPDLGGWLTGTFDGVPKMVTLEHLKLALPVAFPAEERLLAFPDVGLGNTGE